MFESEREADVDTYAVFRSILYSLMVLCGAGTTAVGLWEGNPVQWSIGAVFVLLGLFFLAPMFVDDPHAVD